MNRRDFIKSSLINAIVLGCSSPLFAETLRKNQSIPQVAITIDDPNIYQTPLMSASERNLAILDSLKNHSNLKTTLFVCGKRIDNPAGRKLLSFWDEQSHILANHTYSHYYYHSKKIDPGAYIKDILKCEKVIKDHKHFGKFFRYPFLKAGETIKKRDGVRQFLKAHNYRHGYVTIDASDWYIDDRLNKRLKENPNADLTSYREFYLKHIFARASFYNDLSIKVLKRQVKHTIIIHHNLLNALFLGDMLNMFKQRGWQIIDASDAFQDPIFDLEPDIIPAGESIIWSIAKESGKFDDLLRYPAEDSKYEKDEMDILGL